MRRRPGSGTAFSHFRNPTRLVFGAGVLEELEPFLPDGPVAIVTSSGSTARGLTGRIAKLAGETRCVLIDNVSSNPGPIDILRHLETLPPEVLSVVAAGGGSVMDTGKVLGALHDARLRGRDGRRLREISQGQAAIGEGETLPVLAVPTTAGTGSEVTPFATVWDRERGQKKSVAGPGLYPSTALVDPELTLSLPEGVTVATGLDALSQGLEAWWNRNAGPVTDACALQAIRMALGSLERAVAAPDDLQYRSRMMEASLLAGLAISETRTAAAHSMSYPLTLHLGMPHGLACSYTLPVLLRFNSDGPGRERIVELASALGHSSVEGLSSRIRDLLRTLGVRSRMERHGFDLGRIPALGPEMITPGRAENNLRTMRAEQAVEIARLAWEELG